jgi:hypothetical protein
MNRFLHIRRPSIFWNFHKHVCKKKYGVPLNDLGSCVLTSVGNLSEEVSNVSKMFSGYQPCQLVKNLCPHHQGYDWAKAKFGGE